MKFQPELLTGLNAISRHSAHEVSIQGHAYREALIVPWKGSIQAWDVKNFEALEPKHFERIAMLRPELLIFGSGDRLRFPSAMLMRPLIERGIGHETMDNGAACRTYNVLVSEGRKALLALLLPPSTAFRAG